MPSNELNDMVSSFINKPVATSGRPYFLGSHGLIKFSDGVDGESPSIYWLVSEKDHTIRPFESDAALAAAFGPGVEEAKSKCVHVAHPSIANNGEITDGILKGYELLGPEHAVHNDGSALPVEVSLHHLKKRYGKPINQDAEEKAVNMLDNLLSSLSAGQDGISAAAVEKIKRNERYVASLVNALAYGSYNVSDVKRSIIAKSKQ